MTPGRRRRRSTPVAASRRRSDRCVVGRRRAGARRGGRRASSSRPSGSTDASPALPARGRRRGRAARDGPGDRDRDRLLPRLRLLLHRAALHVHGPRPGGVAQPAAPARRRHRRRPAWPAASATGPIAAHRGRARGARPVQRQLHARQPSATPAAALAPIAAMLRDETRMRRGSGSSSARRSPPTRRTGRRPAARPRRRSTSSLRRRPGDEPAEWVRVHAPGRGRRGRRDRRRRRPTGSRIAAGDQTLGSIWATRPRELGDPDDGRDAGPGRRRRPDRRFAGARPARSARRRRPRSRGGATRSSPRSSTRCRTTCGRRWRRSGPRPGR